jgi:hypothetical protein
MEEDIEYGRGRRHITKPELLSLVAEQNQLVKKKIAVEQRMSTRKALDTLRYKYIRAVYHIFLI